MKAKGNKTRPMVALSAMPVFEVPIEGGAPKEFRIFSAGHNDTEKGDFVFDEVAAQAVMSFWAGKGVELPFDYEHQALSDPPIEAPAAGWWTPEIRNGELWATNVRWTDKARAYLEAKEYRYFSPAFEFDQDSQRVTRLFNVALTNIPAMNRIEPLVAASANKETAMDYEKLCAELKAQLAALTAEHETLKAKLNAFESEGEKDDEEEMCSAVGLKAGADASARLSAVRGLSGFRAEVRKITGQDSDAAALGLLTAWKSEAADSATLKAEKAALEEAALKAELAATLEAATRDGKVPPSEDHPLRKSLIAGVHAQGMDGKLTRNGIAWLNGLVAGLNKLVPDAKHVEESNPAGLVSDAQLAVLKVMGRDPKKFAEFKAREMGRRK